MEKMLNEILEVLHLWSEPTDLFDGVWLGYDGLIAELDYEYCKHDLQNGMKELSVRGLVKLRPTYDEDLKLNGRGWFLTDSL